jgi:hypothetical protein
MKISVARSADTAVETDLELDQIKRASPTHDAFEKEVGETRRLYSRALKYVQSTGQESLYARA